MVATRPVHHEVCFSAPFQPNEKWMWSVCSLAPVYGRQPSLARYAPQIRSFQMMYMIPKRRAFQPSSPCGPGPISQFRTLVATAASEPLWALSIQSHARPSLCSERPPEPQARVMPPSEPRLYVANMSARKATTPGLATGSQDAWGMYASGDSAAAGSLTRGTGALRPAAPAPRGRLSAARAPTTVSAPVIRAIRPRV